MKRTPRSLAYRKLLRDPRWQKKRLEVFQRDNWACQNCGAQHRELQVHHLHYLSGHMPWEYDDAALLTLCVKCHKAETVKQRATPSATSIAGKASSPSPRTLRTVRTPDDQKARS